MAIPWKCPDGNIQWIEVNDFMGENEKGEPVANLLGRNVTEQVEQSQRQERERAAATAKDRVLSEITRTLYGYNVTVDLATLKCSVISGTGCDGAVGIFGRCPTYREVVEEFMLRISNGDARKKAEELFGVDAIQKAAAEGKSGFIRSVVYPTRSENADEQGTIGWRKASLFIGTDEKGATIANILGRNITEEHNEQERQEREREAAAAKDKILSEITQSLYGYNLIVNLNTLKYSLITGTGMDAACEVFKKSEDYAEAVRTKLEFIVPNDRDRMAKLMEPESLRQVAAEGSSGALSTAVYEANVNGEHQWHETNVFIGMNANGDPIANILGRNITEQHTRADAEAQLLAAQEANKAKTAFLFSMSHDIRTPMNAIMGFTDIAKKNLDDRKKLVDCLVKIENSGALLLSLINSVLDMSRVESGKAKVEETTGDVMSSFASIETTMRELAKSKGVSISFEYGEIFDRYIYADFNRCARVFVNIISNAIKYSKPNGWVKVKCEQEKVKFFTRLV